MTDITEDRAPRRRSLRQGLGSQSLSDRWAAVNQHPSGFDYMRIALACSVLLWHSYQISYGWEAALGFWETPAGFGLELILPMFFCLSGFLVTGSLERNRDLRKFLTLRVIRIYPALCVEVVISALIFGPVLTTVDLGTYFTSRTFFTYFFNTIGWIHYNLPGVFKQNTLPDMVNVSLWTVPYELECYVELSLLVLVGFMRARWISFALFLASTALTIGLLRHWGESGTPPGGLHGRVLVLCFLAGTVVFRLREVLPFSGGLALASAALAIAMLRFDISVCLAPLFVAYTTVYLGMQDPRRTIVVSSGDYSYGVYLYASPFQQAVSFLLGPSNSWGANVALALPLTVMFALFSWHVVEKPFLRVKRLILR